jgi:hypothetical protein
MKSFLCVSLLLASCALDEAEDLGSTDQASTLLDVCAVGHAANATSSVTPASYDAFSRSSTTMNLTGANRCDCLDWQDIADSQGDDAANLAYPKCRPETFVDFTVTGATAGSQVQFGAFTELTEKVHTQVDCSRSTLEMQVWKSVGRGVWQVVWSPRAIAAHWDAGRCYQTMGAGSPTVPNGLYRVKAVATPTGEQGYETVKIYAGTP